MNRVAASQVRLFVGVDVSREGYQVALLPEDRDLTQWWATHRSIFVRPKRQDFDQLKERIREWSDPPEARVAIDHTGGYYVAPLVLALESWGCDVCYIPGISAKQIRQRLLLTDAKSDDLDAKTLAYALYLRTSMGLTLRTVSWDPDLEQASMALLLLVRLRQQLVRSRVRAVNRLRQLLAASFPEGATAHQDLILRVAAHYPSAYDIRIQPDLEDVSARPRDKDSLRLLAADSVGISVPSLREGVQAWAEAYQRFCSQVSEVERRLATAVARHPYGPIVQSFPGVGPVRGATLIGMVGDIHRWPTAAQLKKSVGFYGDIIQSGSSFRVGRGKRGRRLGKIVAIQTVATLISMADRYPNPFTDCYWRHRRRGLPPLKAAYKAASKFVEVLHRCLRTGELYQQRN